MRLELEKMTEIYNYNQRLEVALKLKCEEHDLISKK